MKNRKLFISTVLLCLVPILIGGLLYSKLPDMIPTHFDASGVANDYSSKNFAIFGLPLLMLAVHLFTWFMLAKDPKHNNQYKKLLFIVRLFIPLLSIIITTISYLIALGYDVNVTMYIMIIIGVLFILLGNYLPKVKQNYTMGIRTPWTLDDEDNWIKTHRLAGVLFVIMGLLLILIVFLPEELVTRAVLPVIIIPIVIIYIYSYLLYKQKSKNEN